MDDKIKIFLSGLLVGILITSVLLTKKPKKCQWGVNITDNSIAPYLECNY